MILALETEAAVSFRSFLDLTTNYSTVGHKTKMNIASIAIQTTDIAAYNPMITLKRQGL
jgi:hypothetical protein